MGRTNEEFERFASKGSTSQTVIKGNRRIDSAEYPPSPVVEKSYKASDDLEKGPIELSAVRRGKIARINPLGESVNSEMRTGREVIVRNPESSLVMEGGNRASESKSGGRIN